MSPRTLGCSLTGFAVIAAVFRWLGWRVPVFKIPFLGNGTVGWIVVGVLLMAGLWLLWRGPREWQFSPLTLKQLQRFRSIRRGYFSFLLLVALAGVASMDNLLVGKRALLVSYEGKLYAPFVTGVLPGEAFGLDYKSETDYRELQKKFRKENKGNWLVMPPVPFAASLDAPQVTAQLEEREGLMYEMGSREPFSGPAYSMFKEPETQKRQEIIYRKGIRSGEMRGWDAKGDQIEKGTYVQGKLENYVDFSNGGAAELVGATMPEWWTLVYPPSAPSWHQKHFLGTNSSGGDVLAILFGGWQQAIIAAVLFVSIVFVAGVVIGGTLGYFGGLYDLIGQRLVEIWSVLPFLFIVMIVSSIISPTLVVLVGILAIFGWVGTTTYLRTATYREKERDYVAAAKLQGASTARILFHHVLPNVVAILVTLAPFEMAGVITSLAALDFLGFGLPPDYPSWGRLLQEGTENFNYPWIVSSAFVAMVSVLVLVTFVGEAVREAFDPKKFTTYE
ncbi:ABC transporter permease subunit [Phragmitibacter flavus]|uniref:ABC transporter permease subunit n=1 Tax=Phragmitibacter flavus TaxID=2576071 RepID=A0A5R8KKJ0_9BACT|nr:ABC transporter permease subunit [Phragmitibacter flavus]TLD72848.1 ABC transporter permease subunit [Phragmitibacter flavus]